MPTSRQSSDVVIRFLTEVVDNGRLGVLDDFVDPDVAVHEGFLWSPEGTGRACVAQGVRDLLTAFPDLAVNVVDLVADEGRVAARVQCTGTHGGVALGLDPVSGVAGRWITAVFFRVDDHPRITEIFGVVDQVALRRQLGLA